MALLRAAAAPGAPLVVGFNELNGWDELTFQRRLREWGNLTHTAFLRAPRTGYHLGLASDLPLAHVVAHSEPWYHHGLLTARLAGGFTVAVAHLSPRSAAARLAEVRALLRRSCRAL